MVRGQLVIWIETVCHRIMTFKNEQMPKKKGGGKPKSIINQINWLSPIYFLVLIMYRCHYWVKLDAGDKGTSFLKCLLNL